MQVVFVVGGVVKVEPEIYFSVLQNNQKDDPIYSSCR
jgi:hypothetical protein